MKHFRPFVCLLATTFFAVSIAACAQDDEITAPPIENEPPVVETPAENEPPVSEDPPIESEPPAAEEPPAATPQSPPSEPVVAQKNPTVSTKAQYILVRTNGLNIRAQANTDSASLGKVQQGELLQYVKKAGAWYETRYKNRTAFVSANAAYTAVTEIGKGNETTEKIVAEGLLLLGTPYVYGAVRYHDGNGKPLKNFTTAQFDCSSLMQYIFLRGAGKLLGLTTRDQVRQGIPATQLRRGDLLFFTNASRYNNTGIARVGHVALYLGDNYILHTASDYAKIEQISAQRWNYFLEARRI